MTERIEVADENFELLLSPEQIQTRVRELGEEITADYKDIQDEGLVLIGILKGAKPLVEDLEKAILHPNLEVDYMPVSSYGSGTQSSRHPVILEDITADIKGKHVIIGDDIADTGHTIKEVINHLSKKEPLSIKVCSLIIKEDTREVSVPVDYIGFSIPNLWVQGYGLDTNEQGREWPYIAYKK